MSCRNVVPTFDISVGSNYTVVVKHIDGARTTMYHPEGEKLTILDDGKFLLGDKQFVCRIVERNKFRTLQIVRS